MSHRFKKSLAQSLDFFSSSESTLAQTHQCLSCQSCVHAQHMPESLCILMTPRPPFRKNHGNTQIMHKSSRIIKMTEATPNGRERSSISVSALQSKIPHFAHILLFLYSAILCLWADSVCSSCMWLWMSNCSFTQHVSECPPNWCIYNDNNNKFYL